jgi:hypothetical protein
MREECSFSVAQVQGLEAMNAPQGVAEEIREGIGVRQSEYRFALGMDKVRRRKEELSPQTLQRGALKT